MSDSRRGQFNMAAEVEFRRRFRTPDTRRDAKEATAKSELLEEQLRRDHLENTTKILNQKPAMVLKPKGFDSSSDEAARRNSAYEQAQKLHASSLQQNRQALSDRLRIIEERQPTPQFRKAAGTPYRPEVASSQVNPVQGKSPDHQRQERLPLYQARVAELRQMSTAMKASHTREAEELCRRQERQIEKAEELRAGRFRPGLRGTLDKATGRHDEVAKRNAIERQVHLDRHDREFRDLRVRIQSDRQELAETMTTLRAWRDGRVSDFAMTRDEITKDRSARWERLEALGREANQEKGQSIGLQRDKGLGPRR